MAYQDVLPSYFDNLMAFYTNIAPAKGGGPPTPNDPRELFTGIGNWADFCIAPRDEHVLHPVEPIDNKPDGDDGPYSTYNPGSYDVDTPDDNRPDNLPMPNLTVESFFDAANMLTGSYLSSLGEAWGILKNDYINFAQEVMSDPKNPSHGPGPENFFATIANIFDNWDGDAQQAAADYASALHDAVNFQLRMVSWLGDSLMAYSGIMLGARRRMLDLMNAYRETMREKERTDATGGREFVIGVLSAAITTAVGVVFTLATAESGVGATLSAQFISLGINLAGEVLKKAPDKDPAHDPRIRGAGYADYAVSYLQEAGKVVADTTDALNRLVHDNADNGDPNNPMQYLTDPRKWKKPPDPLITRSTFDKDPGAIDQL